MPRLDDYDDVERRAIDPYYTSARSFTANFTWIDPNGMNKMTDSIESLRTRLKQVAERKVKAKVDFLEAGKEESTTIFKLLGRLCPYKYGDRVVISKGSYVTVPGGFGVKHQCKEDIHHVIHGVSGYFLDSSTLVVTLSTHPVDGIGQEFRISSQFEIDRLESLDFDSVATSAVAVRAREVKDSK